MVRGLWRIVSVLLPVIVLLTVGIGLLLGVTG